MHIAVLDDYAGRALDLADWTGLGAEVTVFSEPFDGRDSLLRSLAPFDIVCLMRERTPFPAEVIDGLPALKFIVTSGPRNAAIDVAAAKRRGIVVSGTESRKTTTAELAMLMILALNRGLSPESRSLEAGGWQTGLGRDLHGLTLGLIGLGDIGARVAALGRAFGMEVCAWSRNLTEGRCADLGVRRMESLTALMAASDCASAHMVLSDRSRGLVGGEAFAAAKPGFVFVNTSRGPIVDTAALIARLRVDPAAKAGLDVFDREPPPESDVVFARDLIAEGRLLLTPHLGYATEETFRLFYGQTVEAIEAWRSGRPIRVLE